MQKTKEAILEAHQAAFARDGIISIKGLKSVEIAGIIGKMPPNTWLSDGDDPNFTLNPMLIDHDLMYVNFLNCNFAKVKFGPVLLFRSGFLLCDLRETNFAETDVETVHFDYCLTDGMILNRDRCSVISVRGSDPVRILTGGGTWKAGEDQDEDDDSYFELNED